MKKLISIALAVMLILSLATVAFAADPGSITISGASSGNTYTIYKMLDLESYDKAADAYAYKVNAAWAGFFAQPEALTYVSINDAGYVSWVTNADAVAFAKMALAYAKEHNIAKVESITSSGGNVVFDNLPLGYYLLDSTMGALCGLTTTNPNATVDAKNAPPTIDKQVKEDSTETWTDRNTAEIGQVVEFRTTINVHKGAQNYILHDKMSAGLTFDPNSVKVNHIVTSTNTTTETPTTYYTVHVAPTCGHGCTFHVVFSSDFTDHLNTNDKVVVFYNATLNANATIGTIPDTNTAYLQFGETSSDHTTTPDSTETYTYGFDLVKTAGQSKLLDGAEFKIYDAETGGNEITVTKVNDTLYRRAMTGDSVASSIIVKGGIVRIEGLDNGTYWLEETVAPAGYNKLTARQSFVIADGDLNATLNDAKTEWASGGVRVVNQSGNQLPETGAMGTVMFVTFGVFVMLGTGVLLVTKKRMSMIED